MWSKKDPGGGGTGQHAQEADFRLDFHYFFSIILIQMQCN